MEVRIERSFQKDISKIGQKNIKLKLKKLIESCILADQSKDISGLKKLSGFSDQYRIRLGHYRIGLLIKDDVMIFVRILHRKDIYKYFP